MKKIAQKKASNHAGWRAKMGQIRLEDPMSESDQAQDPDQSKSYTRSGIPRGNTVAIVGDPGTGKTTFLLTYVTFGRIVTDNKDPTAVVCLTPEKGGPRPSDPPAYAALDQLYRPAATATSPSSNPSATLRCFVSLENSLSRLRDNHGKLLETWCPQPPTDTYDDDEFIFIDATAFLSGRLEDRLRYPLLSKNDSEDAEKGRDLIKEHTHDLSLGGHGRDDDQHFGLYYQQDNNEPKRIDQLDDDDGPFRRRKDEEPLCHRAFNLMTRPLPDPMQRVRLLKDLLAEIFVRFPDHPNRLLAIDSLSALLNPFGELDVSANASPARRLHILNLVRWLEEYRVTTFLACEADHDPSRTLGGRPLFLGTEERYLSSGVIQLHYHEYPSGDIVRYLRVLKMRGAAHDMRPHAYDLSAAGIAWLEPLVREAGTVR